MDSNFHFQNTRNFASFKMAEVLKMAVKNRFFGHKLVNIKHFSVFRLSIFRYTRFCKPLFSIKMFHFWLRKGRGGVLEMEVVENAPSSYEKSEDFPGKESSDDAV
jgi:hypothetical protein